ncbi:MAG: polysaccharide pyruvyl transferase family protein [Faecalibacillus sp.]
MKKIAQIGSFDVENYGDLLFPYILETQLKKRLSEVEIILFSPNGGQKPFEENRNVYPIHELEKMHLKQPFDAIIIGGGDVIRLDSDVLSDYERSHMAAELMWIEPILIANRYDIPIVFNAPGVPFSFSNFKKDNVKKLVECLDYCSVRDEESKENLLICQIEKEIEVVPDTIIKIYETFEKNELINNAKRLMENGILPNSRKYIVIQHNRYRYDDEVYLNYMKEFMSMLIEKYDYDILLVPIGYVHKDIDFLNKILIDSHRVHLIESKLSPYDMLSVFVNSCGFIGTSLHGLITSSAYGIPILGINEQNFVKVTGYLKLINKENVEVNDIRLLKKKFEDSFFESTESLHMLRKRVDNHFDTIVQVIETKLENHKQCLELQMLNDLYNNEEINNFHQEINKIKLYYTDQDVNDFNEKYTKKIKISHIGNTYSFQLNLSNVKDIRLDPIEGDYISIMIESIKINGIEQNYIIPFSIEKDSWFDILSPDPQILIMRNNIDDNIVLEMTFKIKYIDMNTIHKDYLELNNKLISLQNEMSYYKKEYPVIFKNNNSFLKKVIRKLMSKL